MSPVSWVWSGLRAALGENLRYDGSQMGGPALIQWGNRYAHFSATASEVLLDESRGSGAPLEQAGPMILPSTDQRNEEFLRLLGQHEAGLLGYILSLVPNWADADDIAQEVRIRLWKQFDSYDRSKDFGTWACTIAHYMVHAHRERLSRYGRLFSSPLADLIAREVAAIAEELSASQQTLKDCFEKLPEGKRELLTTYYSGVHTGREIAAQLGQSYDATRQALVRARMALRDCVDEALREEGR